jgi:hypothetical protein
MTTKTFCHFFDVICFYIVNLFRKLINVSDHEKAIYYSIV